MNTHPAGFARAVDEVRNGPFLLDALRSADTLAAAADHFGDASVSTLKALIDDHTDTLTGIAAIHALSRIYDESAERELSALLSNGRPWVREHAAWAFAARLPRLDAIGRLVASVSAGGFGGMLAQQTLQGWAGVIPDQVALTLEGALAGCPAELGPEAEPRRARMAETLGLVGGAIATRVLVELALDESELDAVRVAAVAALGDRSSDSAALRAVDRLRERDGELGDVARLAAYDIDLVLNPPLRPRPRSQWVFGGGATRLCGSDSESANRPTDGSSSGAGGLTVAQLFLHADIDRGLTRAGAGDNGGIATLLVRLGDALADTDGIARVITMSRGSAAAALAALPSGPDTSSLVGTGPRAFDADHSSSVGGAYDGRFASRIRQQDARGEHLLVPIALHSPPTPSAGAWPSRVAAERGIRRALLALGPVDVLHLRMADVGSLAAASAAERLGIPVVFTLAPDPHAVIHSLDMSGALTRETFGVTDEREHFWFRTRLVDRLARQSAHTVLFPRPQLAADLQALLGIDIEADAAQYTAVAEGIDVSSIEMAVDEARAVAGRPRGSTQLREAGPNAFDELDDLVRALPIARQGLPLAISVGRLHPVKGMATLVEAWATDPVLRSTCNLLVVGGDLASPSADELGQLRAIETVLARHPDARAGLILPGNRPNATVARWLAATRFGLPGLVAPRGVYVCASVKEEFGIALLEALATGLVVVAPDSGGPATYIDDGVTGVLVDTRRAPLLRDALRSALTLSRINPVLEGATEEARIEAAQGLVRDRFTIDAMAGALGHIYAEVAENERPGTAESRARFAPGPLR